MTQPFPTAPRAAPSDPPRDLTDGEALLKRIALKDERALTELYAQCSGTVMAVALHLLRHVAEAEEVVQETFLAVWQKAREYRSDRGSVLSWVTVIARSRAVDWLRGANVRSRLVEKVQQAPAPEAPPTPLEHSEQLGDRLRVAAALGQLPFEQRRALELAFMGGLSHSEIAEVLEEPLGTVKTRIRRGMTRLAELLDGLERP